MRTVRQAGGPTQRRPFYTDAAMERMCVEALFATDLMPVRPAPVRVDRFVEKRFACSPEYEALPAGVLGYTEFYREGVRRVVLAQELDDGTVVSRRRERSTLAHEGGHGLYHAHLFVGEEHPQLLPRERAAPSIMCREVDAAAATMPTVPVSHPARRATPPWHEYQANRAIGGLLLPRALVRQVSAAYLLSDGLLGGTVLADDARPRLVEELVGVFDVNRPVATIRVDQLYPRASGTQLTL